MQRLHKPLLEKRCIDISIIKREHTHSDAPDLEVSVADETAIMAVDCHQVALLDGVIGMRNGSAEHPRMESLQRLLLASL